MAKSGDVLEMEPLGLRLELLQTAEETDGELLELEVSGRPRGFLAQLHVHPTQSERLHVLSGSMRVKMNGREHVIGEGQSIEVPAGTPHTQLPDGDGPGRVRIQVRPAGRTQEFMERVAELCREGKIGRSGLPRPAAGAQLLLDYGDTGHAVRPPLPVQRGLAKLALALAGPRRPYLFVDQWDVAAPPTAVFHAIADARTYPHWWRPVYIDVESDGPAEIGKVSRQHFKGRLPYHLHTRSTITAMDAPRTITAEVEGDLRGTGTWTLTATDAGTHVRFDWQVHADRKLLRVLTPVLRPLFRWNHNWAIARAMEGLDPYARSTSPETQVTLPPPTQMVPSGSAEM
jgi:mannose-6-phosphate isomerase-like protein (cupin superfamily)/uncharacterized protein YndB with AHSA1/START domain